MEDRSSRRMRTLVTRMVHRDLSAKKNACALISMMAGSTNRSNQRPDTLMQDRIARINETSCTARPDHTFGSISPVLPPAQHGSLTPNKLTNIGRQEPHDCTVPMLVCRRTDGLTPKTGVYGKLRRTGHSEKCANTIFLRGEIDYTKTIRNVYSLGVG